jgi:hypothetical protein
MEFGNEDFDKFLKFDIGRPLFWSFLKKEQQLEEIYGFIIKIKQLIEFYDFSNDLIETKFLTTLKDCILTLSKLNDEQFKELKIKLENLLLEKFDRENSMNDVFQLLKKSLQKYYEKFLLSKDFEVFKKFLTDSINKSTTLSILKEKEWSFNTFYKYVSLNMEHRNPVHFSQFLLSKFLDYLAKPDSNELYSLKELSTELQIVKYKELSNEDKISFFVNIFNTLIIHSLIHLKKMPFNNPYEFHSYLSSCHYNIGGKNYSLFTIKKKLKIAFQKLTSSYPPNTIYLSLLFPIKGTIFKVQPLPKTTNIIPFVINISQQNLLNHIRFQEEIALPFILKEPIYEGSNDSSLYKKMIQDILKDKNYNEEGGEDSPINRKGNPQVNLKERKSFLFSKVKEKDLPKAICYELLKDVMTKDQSVIWENCKNFRLDNLEYETEFFKLFKEEVLINEPNNPSTQEEMETLVGEVEESTIQEEETDEKMHEKMSEEMEEEDDELNEIEEIEKEIEELEKAESKEYQKTSNDLDKIKKKSSLLIQKIQNGIKYTLSKIQYNQSLFKDEKILQEPDFEDNFPIIFHDIRKSSNISELEFYESIFSGDMKIVITPGIFHYQK